MKSKGRTTYWALREVGQMAAEPLEAAFTESQKRQLVEYIKDKNSECDLTDEPPLELVRVEVTPV